MRQVRSPAQFNRTTVIQKNYYSRGYNSGYGGGNYNRGGYGGGMGGGSGLGTSLLGGAAGAIGGMMLYNALTDHNKPATTQTTTQTVMPAQEVAQIQQEQRIEDKLDQVNEKLDNAAPQTAMAGPQGYSLPSDAPLMMSPDFYKLGSGQ